MVSRVATIVRKVLARTKQDFGSSIMHTATIKTETIIASSLLVLRRLNIIIHPRLLRLLTGIFYIAGLLPPLLHAYLIISLSSD
jgi:hypothetical protein